MFPTLSTTEFAAPTLPKDSSAPTARSNSSWSRETIFTSVGVFVTLISMIATLATSKKARRGFQRKLNERGTRVQLLTRL